MERASPKRPRATGARIGLALSLALSACADVGPFVWVDDYRQGHVAPDAECVIAVGDVISARVYQQDAMSGRVRVREDGKVSLPFVDDVVAAGRTPTALARQLEERLKPFVNTPVVTVSIEETRPLQISVLGAVVRPGIFPATADLGVLEALAAAGGMSEYAQRDRIFVLRPTRHGRERIRFTYQALVRAVGAAGQFRLQPGDTVVVE